MSRQIQRAYDLTTEFFTLVRERQGDQLLPWVEKAEPSGLPALAKFATGLRRDREAVMAGVSSKWSTGPVEGQINRLKVIKRQRNGRAKLDLPRARVLPETVARSGVSIRNLTLIIQNYKRASE